MEPKSRTAPSLPPTGSTRRTVLAPTLAVLALLSLLVGSLIGFDWTWALAAVISAAGALALYAD